MSLGHELQAIGVGEEDAIVKSLQQSNTKLRLLQLLVLDAVFDATDRLHDVHFQSCSFPARKLGCLRQELQSIRI